MPVESSWTLVGGACLTTTKVWFTHRMWPMFEVRAMVVGDGVCVCVCVCVGAWWMMEGFTRPAPASNKTLYRSSDSSHSTHPTLGRHLHTTVSQPQSSRHLTATSRPHTQTCRLLVGPSHCVCLSVCLCLYTCQCDMLLFSITCRPTIALGCVTSVCLSDVVELWSHTEQHKVEIST